MKKAIRIICLAVGGILIGAYANQLHTGNGAAMFCLGILLAVSSMITVSKKENKTKTKKKPEKINPYQQKQKSKH